MSGRPRRLGDDSQTGIRSETWTCFLQKGDRRELAPLLFVLVPSCQPQPKGPMCLLYILRFFNARRAKKVGTSGTSN
jgi:hypothetical protein